MRIKQEGPRCVSRRSATPAEYTDGILSRTRFRVGLDSSSESEAGSDNEILAESVSDPVLGPVREPTLVTFRQPVLEGESVGESARYSIHQSFHEPVSESAREPMLESVHNPVIQTHCEMSPIQGVAGQYILTDLVSSCANELLNSAIRILNAIKCEPAAE
ncbi:hypothetical protein MRX96_024724 [Rhipicephalus microplus]